MRNYLLQAAAASLLVAAPGEAGAQAPGSSLVEPNLYDFAARKFSVSYSTSSLAGEPLLTLTRDTGRQRQFKGEEIRVEETDIGQLVSVLLRQVADLKFVSLTLLIPAVNLEAGETKMFETQVFFTTHHTTIAGPDGVDGPLQTYLPSKVIGQASHVDFLAAPGGGVFGKVTQSPTCPGPVPVDKRCTGPVPDAEVQLLDAAANVVTAATTDAHGLFALRAPAGEYTLNVDTGGILPHCESVAVTLGEHLAPTTIRCETGLR